MSANTTGLVEWVHLYAICVHLGPGYWFVWLQRGGVTDPVLGRRGWDGTSRTGRVPLAHTLEFQDA